MQTFLRIFEGEERPTEYLAITTITSVRVEPDKVVIKTLEGATREIVSDRESVLAVLDSLSEVPPKHETNTADSSHR